MSDNTVIVDDSDHSVTYGPTGAWTPETGAALEDGFTLHSTSFRSAWAFLKFNGTAITVVGPVNITSGQTIYVLDGTDSSVSNSIDVLQYGLQGTIYTSPPLTYGVHTLNISLVEEGRTLSIDHFQVTTARANTRTDSDDTPLIKLSAGVIAGILMGVCILLIVAISFGVAVRRTRRRHWWKSTPSAERDSDILGCEVKEFKGPRRTAQRAHDPRPAVTQSSTGTTVMFSTIFSVTGAASASDTSTYPARVRIASLTPM